MHKILVLKGCKVEKMFFSSFVHYKNKDISGYLWHHEVKGPPPLVLSGREFYTDSKYI